MTDVLGICESWADRQATVRTADGQRVVIDIGTIVSGKPVPPRPSVRHRVTAADAERHALVMWPDIERVPLGDWILRSDPAPVGRLIKRANSCLAIGDPGMDLSDAISRVHDWYAVRERPVLVQTDAASRVDEEFARHGWEIVVGGSSCFQIAPLSRAVRTAGRLASEQRERLHDTSSDRRIEVTLDEDVPRVSARIGDLSSPRAVGRGALDGDWFGIHGFEVDPAMRRRGLATTVMAELLDWAAAHGATTAWLHVEIDNRPALTLYERLGFVTHHSLHYRQAPA